MTERNRMELKYDEEIDVAYIYIDTSNGNWKSKKTIELNENIILDFDKNGKLRGIEILEASKNLPSNTLKTAILI